MMYDELVSYLEKLQRSSCDFRLDWSFGAIDFSFSLGFISRSQYLELLDKYCEVEL